MPLISLRDAARELGYKSIKSIERAADKGLLEIKLIPGKVRPTRRVDSADIERIKRGQASVTLPAAPTQPLPRGRRPSLRMPKPVSKVKHYE